MTDEMPDRKIHKLTIKGFKTIRSLENFEMRDINVLIGANGSGKSNFISYFRMLGELVEGRLQFWVRKQGGADRILTYGIKETEKLATSIFFGKNAYGFVLQPSDNDGLIFADEAMFYSGVTKNNNYYNHSLGKGHLESLLKQRYEKQRSGIPYYIYPAVSAWKVFHFHDTSDTALMKRLRSLDDDAYLRPDASNLAAYLYRLRKDYPNTYQQIRKTVQLAIPFFDDFVLNPETLPTGEQQIRLLWQQRDSDYPMWASQLSDGSLRFICLTTAFLQPDPPSTIIIDEPELGLHPYAIDLLGALVKSASTRMQVILSTQSVLLLNEFELEDIIVVEREDGVSTFKRHNSKDFELWLEDYTIGELWEKNVLGGIP